MADCDVDLSGVPPPPPPNERPHQEERKASRGLAGLSPDEMPFVTLCTPTFNRRPFFAAAMSCVMAQTYPRHRMEWLIVDDGTDPVGDLFPPAARNDGLPTVRYVYTGPGKMPLGAKRNYMNALARGEVLVYWDDDDYYPPGRVAHAVDLLLNHPEYRIAGAKAIDVYYAETQQVCRYGPYSGSPEMASAATFAFRRSYDGRYDPEAALAEEASFTRGFTEPMLALDPQQTILVFAHDQNSYDKRWALRAAAYQGQFGATESVIDDFVRPASAADWALVGGAPDEAQARLAAELRQFYVDEMHVLLKSYAAGSVIHKPDVVAHLKLLGQVPPEVAAELAAREAVAAAAAAAAAAESTPTEASPPPPTPYVLYHVNGTDESTRRALTQDEVLKLVQSLDAKYRFAEKERLATAAERDAIAAQAERWKQECARLRGGAAVVAPLAPTPAAGAGGPQKKRKYGLEEYERCIAVMCCEQHV